MIQSGSTLTPAVSFTFLRARSHYTSLLALHLPRLPRYHPHAHVLVPLSRLDRRCLWRLTASHLIHLPCERPTSARLTSARLGPVESKYVSQQDYLFLYLFTCLLGLDHSRTVPEPVQ